MSPGSTVELTRESTDFVGARIGAQLIDLALLAMQAFVVVMALRSVLGSGSFQELLRYSSLTLPLYGGVLERVLDGQTIGKRVLEIKVVDGTGGPPSLRQSLGRNLPAVFLLGFGLSLELAIGTAVVPLLVGLVVIVASDRRQRPLDHLLGTFVVDADPDDDEPKRYVQSSVQRAFPNTKG